MSRFQRKYGSVALVLGGAEGLGFAFCEEIRRKGLDLWVVDRSREKLAHAQRELQSRGGGSITTMVGDLSEAAFWPRLFEALDDVELGLVIYNAAEPGVGDFLALDMATHERVVAVNCLGPTRLAHWAGRRFAQQGRGGIILLSSMSALCGSARVASYAASKAYAWILAEGMWQELQGAGVDVLSVLPGPTLTPGYLSAEPNPMSHAQPPGLVAAEALETLAKGPSMAPGRGNRALRFLQARLLPRRWAMALVAWGTRSLRGPSWPPG